MAMVFTSTFWTFNLELLIYGNIFILILSKSKKFSTVGIREMYLISNKKNYYLSTL